MKIVRILLALLVAAPLAAQGQSVVDIAKQKANAPKPSRVYTNDDVATRSDPQPGGGSAGSGSVNVAELSSEAAASVDPSRSPDLLKIDPAKATAADAQAARDFVKAKQVQIDSVTAELADRQEKLRTASNEGDIDSLTQAVANLRFNIDFWTMQRNKAQQLVTAYEQRQKQQKPEEKAASSPR